MKKLSFSILLVLIVLLLRSASYGQAICPITTLKIGGVKGKVLWNDKTSTPITKTKVELIRLGEEDSLITSTLTDENGFFEINNLEKGKYGLDVWLYVDDKPYFVYRVALKVTKSNAAKSNSLIVVKLGLDCWTSEAGVVKSTAASNKSLHRSGLSLPHIHVARFRRSVNSAVQ